MSKHDDCDDFIPLFDMGDWAEFWTANAEALVEVYETEDAALRAACCGGLVIGGGAAPLFRVAFVDE